jgi:type I site-specific restriction-modification system R (restriction) subunit
MKPKTFQVDDDDLCLWTKTNRRMDRRRFGSGYCKRQKNADQCQLFCFYCHTKNKTLELFGEKYNDNGKEKFKAFHLYSMKQAIEENFILDVLQNYTTYQSYYALLKKIEDDPLTIKQSTKETENIC